MKEPATFPSRAWDGLSDNPSRTSLNDDITPDTRDWDRIVAELIATETYVIAQVGGANGLPLGDTATGSPVNYYVLYNNAGSTSWYDFEAALLATTVDNPDVDNRYEAYKITTDPGTLVHGTPVRLTLVAGVLGSGQSDDATLTANTAIETDVFNGWLLTVVESPSGNRTNPVSTVDIPNQTVTCTVPNTGNTTWNAIVTSWNAAQSDLVADLVAGSYRAGVTTTGNSTIQINNGVLEEVRATTLNAASGNANEAAVFGLVWNGSANTGTTPNSLVQIQTGGTMTFTADQTANVVEASVLSSGAMVPGEAYYAGQLGDNGKMTNAPEAYDKLCAPIGLVTSPTTLRLRLGLPVMATAPA